MDGVGSVQGGIYSASSQACRRVSPERRSGSGIVFRMRTRSPLT
ncbi:hypothetical protein HALO32_01242 [Halomonas lysinitropha]|uniref:Uncharacterized protein n=1 Tax=Halomonas lysinitropha TaxID=2607506 RepID=A0A5K1I4W7_9GAMM|nr:hypothetical protein HALO32_01242 [Halomonas lysinitropha]